MYSGRPSPEKVEEGVKSIFSSPPSSSFRIFQLLRSLLPVKSLFSISLQTSHLFTKALHYNESVLGAWRQRILKMKRPLNPKAMLL